MEKEQYTRASPKEKTHETESSRINSHADKLKNESSAKSGYHNKFRHGKNDNKSTRKETGKKRKIKNQGRRKIYKDEALKARTRNIASNQVVADQEKDDNAGTDALDFGIGVAETTVDRAKNYSRKLHARNEHLDSVQGAKGAKAAGEAGEGSKSMAVKQARKKLMQKEFAEAAYKKQAADAANSFGNISKRFTDKAEDLMGRLAEWFKEFLEEHLGVLLVIALVLLVVLVISGSLTSCSALMGAGNDVVVTTSFTADDDQILAVEQDYVDKEADLQDTIDNIESDYPNYDEYNYSLAEISHNPYELAALLTVLYEDYTESEVQTILQTIFDYQYDLDIEEVVEKRTRTETRTGYSWVSTGVVNGVATGYWDSYQYDVEVEYDYCILNVTLTNNGISAAVNALGLTEDQLKRYYILVETKGNKANLFADNPYANPGVSDEYQDYAVPGEYMTDEKFANMLHEAEKYLGYPYVWGGSSPSTSFDCSGFVSYVINHSGNGWNYGRLTANGWKNATQRVAASDVHAGDLIFFQGTYNTSGASHVGIVVDPVNKIMIHCGNPIQYASYDTSYWRAHAYCYGRLP